MALYNFLSLALLPIDCLISNVSRNVIVGIVMAGSKLFQADLDIRLEQSCSANTVCNPNTIEAAFRCLMKTFLITQYLCIRDDVLYT